MFWYRGRQNVKPSGLSGSPWLIGIWRFRPLVRMVDRWAALLMAASPSASAKDSAKRRPWSRCPPPPLVSIVQRVRAKTRTSRDCGCKLPSLQFPIEEDAMVDETRRKILKTGAVAAAVTAVRPMLAQQNRSEERRVGKDER